KTLRRKLARQAARSVLPNATETKIFVTANARALRHFIELRASRHAEVEIRKLALQVLGIMQGEAPHLFSDYQLTPLPDRTFEAATQFRKVKRGAISGRWTMAHASNACQATTMIPRVSWNYIPRGTASSATPPRTMSRSRPTPTCRRRSSISCI